MSPPKKMLTPEGELQVAVIKRCASYRDVHVIRLDPGHRSQRGADNAGFPDLMIVGPNGVLFRELKTEYGRARGLRPAQAKWKHRLLAARQDWAIWSPRDLDAGRIDAQLRALSAVDAEREVPSVFDADAVNAAFALAMSRD